MGIIRILYLCLIPMFQWTIFYSIADSENETGLTLLLLGERSIFQQGFEIRMLLE
jgi:hypothetical protein